MMPLKTPKFWYTKPADTLKQGSAASAFASILRPVSTLYQLGHKTKLRLTKSSQAPLPVICVGNVTAGGSGKTPTCIALNSLIRKYALFSDPYFLTRGYGGSDPGPRRIVDHDTVQKVGDEPLLLANHSNTILSVNRLWGAKKAHDLGADLIIMDDGLQNLSLHKDISFLVLDGALGLGNQQTLPAGPLREPLSEAVKRSDAIIIIGEDTYGLRSMILEDKPVFEAHIAPDKENDPVPTNKPYIAFAGIAAPQKFFETLRNNGLAVIDTKAFPDHHPYNKNDIQSLLDYAEKSNARLITTEKDYVRLPKALQEQVYMYPVTLQWNNESALIHFIAEKIKQ